MSGIDRAGGASGEVLPETEGAVFDQRFAVSYEYPVHFTGGSVRAGKCGARHYTEAD